MKRVNYEADERVDLPDIRAMGGLVESEFRKQLSQWMFGYAITAVVRGFEVEPENPATTRIKVRMDRSADNVPFLPDSLAVAAENLGARIDFGVLLGGRNSAGELEGAAQLLFDFSTQVPGVYGIEMRVTTTTAEHENRAFWNENTNTEFVNAIDTRITPSWEINAVPAFSGAEWLPLALVNWNGSTIQSGNITDARVLLHEGFALLGFNAVDQATAQFDFNRIRTRGTFGVGAASPMAVISALQRQVLDLKGYDDYGTFNWYERIFSPAGGPTPWGVQTKSLRSIDTVTFTIGWGQNLPFGDWGDFNGETGLNDCLSFIETNNALLPRRIKIVIKNRNPSGFGSPYLAFAMTNPVTINAKDIEIINEMGMAKQTDELGVPKDVRGQAEIRNLVPQFFTALTMTGRCSLRMENLTWANPSYEVNHIFITGPVRLRNVVMHGWDVGGDFAALVCHSDQSEIDHCWFSGGVGFGGGDELTHSHGGSVRHTVFDRAILILRSSLNTSALNVFEILQGTAQKVSFEYCNIIGRLAFGGLNAASVTGCIDARGATHVSWTHCKLLHSPDENGFTFGNLISGVDGGSVNSGSLEVGYGEFAVFSDVGMHLLNNGVNGPVGTGHHIFCAHTALSSSTQRTTGINIHDNWFVGGALGTQPSPDGGAFSLISACNVTIKNNRTTDWIDSVGGFNILFSVTSDGAGNLFTGAEDIKIEDNYFGDWLSDIQRIMCISTSDIVNLQIRGNVFKRYKRDAVSVGPFSGAAMQVINALDFWICDNSFVGFMDFNNPATTNCNLGLSGIISRGHVSRNVFTDFGGIGIEGSFHAITHVEFNENSFEPSELSELKFSAAIDLSQGGGHTQNVTFVGNRWDYVGGSGGTNNKVAIHVGDATSFTVMANHFDRGTIKHATLGGAQAAKATGYGVTSPQLNYVQAYV